MRGPNLTMGRLIFPEFASSSYINILLPQLKFGQLLEHFLLTFSLLDLGLAFSIQGKNNQSYTLQRETVDTGSMRI